MFSKTKSSYERFVKDAHAAAGAFIGWMRASIIPFTFAMVVMPATMVSVLPIGGLLVKGGTLSGQPRGKRTRPRMEPRHQTTTFG